MDLINYAKIKKISSELSNIATQKADNSRVDAIITTPAEGVSAQEIIDARQGEASLGAKITKVGEQINSLDAEIISLDAQKADSVTINNNLLNGLALKRDKSETIKLSDVDAEFISAITGGATVNLESIPQESSVDVSKLTNEMSNILLDTVNSKTNNIIDGTTISANITRFNNDPVPKTGILKTINIFMKGAGGTSNIKIKAFSKNIDGTFNFEWELPFTIGIGLQTLYVGTHFVEKRVEKVGI